MKNVVETLKGLVHRPRNVRLSGPTGLGTKAGATSVRQLIFWGAALVLGVGVFAAVRGLTVCWKLTELAGTAPASCGGSDANNGSAFTVTDNGTALPVPPTPEVAAPEVQYPSWDGGSRINIAFFGLRGGDIAGEDCPQCTDTIIVFTVDPITRSAGMISVPRDMYVNIPGFTYSRINTAWTTGAAAKVPGGGPGLAMQAVSQLLGVPIQYYVQVDFDTFVEIIDLIHGVDIYNDENLVLDRVGSGNDQMHVPTLFCWTSVGQTNGHLLSLLRSEPSPRWQPLSGDTR